MSGSETTDKPTTSSTGRSSSVPPPVPPRLSRDDRRQRLQALQQMHLYNGPLDGQAPKVSTVPPRRPPPLPPGVETPDKLRAKLKNALVEVRKVQSGLKLGAGETKCISDFNAIRDSEKRYQQAVAFKTALQDVPRVAAMFGPLEQAALAGERQANAATPPSEQLAKQWREALNEVIGGRASIRATGLPDGYAVGEGQTWYADLIRQLEPFTKGKDAVENTRLRAQAKQAAPTPQAVNEAHQAAQSLKGAVEKYQVRGMNRASTYFDAGRNGVPISPADAMQAEAATRRIAELGIDILNNGGTYRQVKQLMAETGLTEEFWPPQLVQAVQAWRKTSRALQEEKLRKAHAKSASGQPFTSDDVGNVLESIASIVEGHKAIQEANAPKDEKPDTAGLIEKLATDPEATKTITEWLGGVAGAGAGGVTVVQLFMTIKEMYDAGKEDTPAMEKALKELELASEALTKMLSVTKVGMNFAGQLAGGALQHSMNSIVPGIGIAVAGAELGLALKDLGKASRTLHQTRGEKREALAQFANDDVDEAMINAMTNAMGAESTKVAKNSINVATKGMRLGGSIASTAGGHYGVAASAGITVLASGVDGTSRVIFSGIDWGKARKAKKLVEEAQAGNMEAQVEIFEKSGFYAKMLLAISVKEGGALAKKYVVDRGLEEGDLDKPQSLEILRDAMLDHAEQKNDQEIEDNLLMHFAGRPGKVLVGAAKSLGSGVVNLKERAQRGVTKEYRKVPVGTLPKFDPAAPAAWAEAWESGKATLIANGLIDQSTGLTGALKKAAHADVDMSGQLPDREKLMVAVDAMNEVVSLSIGANPVAFEAQGSPKRIPHESAYEYLSELRKAVHTKIDAYWKAIDQLPRMDVNWAPAAIPDLTPRAWKSFWTEGEQAAAFPKKDAGVGEALTEADTVRQAFEAEQDRGNARKLALAYQDTLDDANEAVLAALELEAVNRREKVRAALDAFMLKLNEERRRVDGWIAGKDQDGVTTTWNFAAFDPTHPDQYAAQWEKAIEYAANGGYLATRGERGKRSTDGGFAGAVQSWQSSYDDYVKAQGKDDPKGQLKAVRTLEVDSGKVRQGLAKFRRLQRAAAEELIEFGDALGDAISAERQRIVTAENNEVAQNRKFDDKPKKSHLSSEDWRNTHDNAVAAGAVLESGAGRKTLSQALKTLKKATAAYEKGLTAKGKDKVKKLRSLAEEYVDAVDAVTEAVEMVRGLKRYNENTQMNTYLDKVKEAAEALLKQGDVVAHAEGTKAQNLNFDPKLEVKVWQKNKALAIANGVIPDQDLNVSQPLGDFLKAQTAQDDAKKRKAQLTLKPALELARTLSKNPEWTSYIDARLLDVA